MASLCQLLNVLNCSILFVRPLFFSILHLFISSLLILSNSVGDPDPQDPHVFGPPGSGSISQMYGSGSGSGSFPFLINGVVWTEIMLAK